MKVLVQWSLASPGDWQEIDLAPGGGAANRWRNAPKKPRPAGGETIDDSPGWIYDVAIYGVWLGGMDHYAVELVGQGQSFAIRTICWNDDPADWWGQTPRRYARVMDFYSGPYPWRVETTYYLEPEAPVALMLAELDRLGVPRVNPHGYPIVVRPWSEFVKPAENITKYGIWLPDSLNRQHVAARRVPSYHEWLG